MLPKHNQPTYFFSEDNGGRSRFRWGQWKESALLIRDSRTGWNPMRKHARASYGEVEPISHSSFPWSNSFLSSKGTALMIRFTVRRKLLAGFGLALLFLAIVGGTAYRSTERLAATAAEVTHSHEVLQKLESLQTELANSDSQARCYVITARPACLQAFRRSVNLTDEAIVRLEALTRDNPSQQSRLAVLKSQLAARLAFFDNLIQVRDRDGLSEAQKLVDAGLATDWRATITQRVGDIRREETTLLQRRQESAAASTERAQNVVLFGSLIAFVSTSIFAFVVARSITVPLEQFREFVLAVGGGDLRRRSKVKGNDEISELSSSLNRMVAGLTELAAQTRAVTSELRSTTMQILSAMQEQAASTSEQAAAIQETNATMAELTQSGLQISDRARTVAANAESMSNVGNTGLEAVQNTTRIMESIQQQTEAVAENIVSLSEKTQAVGDIIATVNDIAEQSHLLALNAAIEAAAAGEYGRSFAVVASEMKNLADQSKEATVQVRSILGDIQKRINGSVMLTEESVKRV